MFEDGRGACRPGGSSFEIGPDQAKQFLQPFGALRIGRGGMPEVFTDMRLQYLRHQPVDGPPDRGDLLQDWRAVCAYFQRALKCIALPTQPTHTR